MKKDPNITHWLHSFSSLLPHLAEVLGILLVIGLVGYVIIGSILVLLNRRRLIRQKVTFLELTPPASNTRSSLATKAWYEVLHGLDNSRPLAEKALLQKLSLSLELVASREQGIRYVMRVPKREAGIIEQQLNSYLPDVIVKRVSDPLPTALDDNKTRLIHFKQSGHPAYSLNIQESLDQLDPIAYLTGALTKLASGELMVVQVVITPTHIKEAALIRHKAMANEDLLSYLNHRKFSGWSKVFGIINKLNFAILDLIGEATHSSSTSYSSSLSSAQRDAQYNRDVARKIKPARNIPYLEQQIVESVHSKVSQPLFHASIRAVVITDSPEKSKLRAQALRASLSSFNSLGYQEIKARHRLPHAGLRKLQLNNFTHRLPHMHSKRSAVLSAAELASIYHFPNSSSSQTENLIRSLSKTLPAPVSLKDGTKLDILLGSNQHHGSATPIGLTEAERERHVYIIGGTGNGKTTMLLYGIVQDIKNGKGVAVIDPHGDLAETILRYIPEQRLSDVIYLNPDDLMHPVGVNLLELPEGLSDEDLLREKDLVTEATISVMRKIFSDDDSGGHRIEYVLRNTIQTALTLEGSTLFTIFSLLNDTSYRKKVIKGLEDKNLKIFWQNELGKAGDFQRVKMAAGITAKIGRFLFSASAKRVLEQEKSTIDFDDILSSGKILICNFSKGLLGEDTSTLFGTTILAKLQMASLRRARIKQTARRPYYLYVDEFQNFATMAFVQMLSEARKYKLFLTMAEQSTSQQDQQRLVDIILANVGTVICFRSGSPADERYVLPLFSPYIEQGEIANLPAFNFYMRIAALKAYEPLSGETVLLEGDGNEKIAHKVIRSSRSLYSKDLSTKPTKKKLNKSIVNVASVKKDEADAPKPSVPRARDATLLDSVS